MGERRTERCCFLHVDAAESTPVVCNIYEGSTDLNGDDERVVGVASLRHFHSHSVTNDTMVVMI